MRILITGIFGSCARYLVEEINAAVPEAAVCGLGRGFSERAIDKVALEELGVELHELDLRDSEAVKTAFRNFKPTHVVQLAANANVAESFNRPAELVGNNFAIALNVLEALRMEAPAARALVCSSSEVYGQPPVFPISENTLMSPRNPYAAGKAAEDLLAKAYGDSFGLQIIRSRAFSYINPRRANLVATSFARQIAEVELGRRQEVTHGNLESRRIFLDVRDIACAYRILLESGLPAEVYNVSGGHECTVGQLLEDLCKRATMPIRCTLDSKLLRPTDLTNQIGTSDRIQALGWKPRYSWDDSMEFLRCEAMAWAKG